MRVKIKYKYLCIYVCMYVNTAIDRDVCSGVCLNIINNNYVFNMFQIKSKNKCRKPLTMFDVQYAETHK